MGKASNEPILAIATKTMTELLVFFPTKLRGNFEDAEALETLRSPLEQPFLILFGCTLLPELTLGRGNPGASFRRRVERRGRQADESKGSARIRRGNRGIHLRRRHAEKREIILDDYGRNWGKFSRLKSRSGGFNLKRRLKMSVVAAAPLRIIMQIYTFESAN